MRFTVVAVAVLAVPLAGSDPFRKSLPAERRIAHALDRLTFGARPGDAETVKKIGLEKWIERQLNPESIPENPQLEKKLEGLATLRMTPAETVQNFPPPQMVRAFAEGRLPPPKDPEQRARLERLAAQFKNRGKAEAAKPENLMSVLAPAEMRALRRGTPEERMEALAALPDDKLHAVLEAMPQANRGKLYVAAPPDLRRRLMAYAAPYQVLYSDLAEGKLYRAVYSERQLNELLVDFWFNHFNVYMDKGADRYLVASYERDAIRPHVLHRFKDLLLATAEHPAMLFYLDNWQSVAPDAKVGRGRARGLNENYARELMELHTLGVDGGYTQKDVTEVARCFTGWTIRDPRRGGGFDYNDRIHDKGEKTVLGVRIAAGGGREDGLKVIDMLARNPSTARFISTKLAQRFVADAPPPAMIARMAKTFQDTDGDLKAVMKVMLRSREFWSEGAWRAKLRSPLEMVAGAVRSLDAEVNFATPLAMQVAALGQPLYRKQEPTGYSTLNEEWVNSAALLARMNFATALVENKVPGVKVNIGGDPKLVALGLGSPEFQRR
jgi:uncharacterized protein (DUF1800 family)